MSYNKWIEVTTVIGCANMCKYCPQKLLIGEYKKQSQLKEGCRDSIMSLDNFKEYISSVPKDVVLDFCGYTEPFLNKHAVGMILYAHEQGYKLRVHTTLRGLSVDDIEKISHIPFLSFGVHLPDVHNIMRYKVESDYNDRLKALQDFKISNLDYMVIGEADESFEKVIGQKLASNKVVLRADNVEKESIPKELVIIEKPKKRMFKRIICRRSLNSQSLLNPAKLETTILLPNGDLTLCCMDYGLKHIIGNLGKQNYKSIVNGKQMKDIYKKMLGHKKGALICDSCDYAIEFNYLDWYKTILKRKIKKLKIFNLLINIKGKKKNK